MKILKWLVFVPLLAFLAWRIVVVNLSVHYARQNSEVAADRALAWVADNPDALLTKALAVRGTDPEQARRLLQRAIPRQPVDGRMFSTLGLILETEGKADRATRAMAIADELAPRASAVQIDLAGFWGQRNDAERYLRHLITVMELRPDRWKETHPALLGVVEMPALGATLRAVLTPMMAADPPSWWEFFFGYAAHRAESVDALRLLYSIRSASTLPRSELERGQFLNRLERERKWIEAYFVWLNQLDESQLRQVGNLFNGSFELHLMDQGFGWRKPKRDGIEVAVAATQGMSDRGALRVGFLAKAAEGTYLSQYLKLPAGTYEFSGRVRADGARVEQAVHWRIDCVEPKRHLLVDGQTFSGTEQWHGFTQRLEVPAEQCPLQQLQLLGRGSRGGRPAAGVLWFDDLNLRAVN